MLVKFLPTYTGGGLGSINYLLNERMAAGTAKVVKGDENLTRAIIKGIDFKQKTCFGVLSFEEKHDFLDEEQKMDVGTHSYDGTDNRNSIGLSDTLLYGGTANKESEIGHNQRTTSDSERANEGDGINESLDDTVSLEAFGARSGWKDAVLHIDPSGRGDYQEKQPTLYTYENGVEDDDVRRSIARRKRELDADDRERKERIRIAEEDLDRKIREGVIEFAATSNRVSAACQEFNRRLQRCLIESFAKTKRYVRQLNDAFRRRIKTVRRRIAKFEGKIRCFADALREVEKRCRKFIKECEHAKMTGVRRTVKNTDKENTIKSDMPGLV